ncbi:hypothetical protein QBC46DRAFT_336661 [Diplogelasinospora grovesii]|uniref:Uncharacterized protein n=1 Tax=Diplogelasinospora grovesii TaxID=303347 RepID=A0AAN6NGI3_9PEZI|nr:hypothetical protein QBC46DRAFT_336661 [Diplogelasinospora grovesii]
MGKHTSSSSGSKPSKGSKGSSHESETQQYGDPRASSHSTAHSSHSKAGTSKSKSTSSKDPRSTGDVPNLAGLQICDDNNNQKHRKQGTSESSIASTSTVNYTTEPLGANDSDGLGMSGYNQSSPNTGFMSDHQSPMDPILGFSPGPGYRESQSNVTAEGTRGGDQSRQGRRTRRPAPAEPFYTPGEQPEQDEYTEPPPLPSGGTYGLSQDPYVPYSAPGGQQWVDAYYEHREPFYTPGQPLFSHDHGSGHGTTSGVAAHGTGASNSYDARVATGGGGERGNPGGSSTSAHANPDPSGYTQGNGSIILKFKQKNGAPLTVTGYWERCNLISYDTVKAMGRGKEVTRYSADAAIPTFYGEVTGTIVLRWREVNAADQELSRGEDTFWVCSDLAGIEFYVGSLTRSGR